jgi:hypothetical protein
MGDPDWAALRSTPAPSRLMVRTTPAGGAPRRTWTPEYHGVGASASASEGTGSAPIYSSGGNSNNDGTGTRAPLARSRCGPRHRRRRAPPPPDHRHSTDPVVPAPAGGWGDPASAYACIGICTAFTISAAEYFAPEMPADFYICPNA